MSKVRLLFAPENTGFADKLASALVESGYDPSVGDDPASAALVVWSQASAASKPILSAARSALARRVLVPVALGKTPPPPSFEHLWPMDLAGWNGRPDDPRWKFVLDELELATRRGVVFRPAAANDRGSPPPSLEAPVKAAPDQSPPPAPPSAEPPRLFADERVETIRPRPKYPRIAIGAGFSLAALAGAGAAALMIGLSDGRRAADRKDDPVVAFVVQPRPEAVAVKPEDSSVAPGPPSTDDLRDGAVPSEDEPAETAVAAVLSQPTPTPPPDDSVPPAPAAVETPAEALAATPAAVDAAPAQTADVDLIAGLAWRSTAVDETPSYGRYLRDCVDCPDLAEIDAGAFLIGAAADETGAQGLEGPQTPVTVTRPIAMSVREVSHDDWRGCAAEGVCPALAGAGERPVNVSQQEAEAYAAWLSGKTGRRYRLPSEAEWEYAARAGDAGANTYGLFGLLSGVREWTADCWRESHAGRPADASAVGGLCQMRVVKGGDGSSAAARDGAVSSSRRADIGFRVVRDLD
jgi:formylglycine-generating enzyme required for sulfatase activity